MTGDHAFLREVSPRYADCLVRAEDRPAIDVARARRQHAAYADALRAAGMTVTVLPAIDAADGCFVEDCAVVLDDELAVATRPGAASRREEVASIRRALSAHRRVVTIGAPATLDGGDVLRIGDRLFVGLSARTNEEGARALGELAAPRGMTVIAVPVRDALHLESAVSALDHDTVLLDPRRVDAEIFSGLGVVETPAGEGDGANVLRLSRPGHVLVARAFTETRRRLIERKLEVTDVDLSEFTKGDAGPTCLSVVLRAGGSAGAE